MDIISRSRKGTIREAVTSSIDEMNRLTEGSKSPQIPLVETKDFIYDMKQD